MSDDETNENVTEGSETGEESVVEPTSQSENINVQVDTSKIQEEMASFRTEMKTLVADKDAKIAELEASLATQKDEMTKKMEDLQKETVEFKSKVQNEKVTNENYSSYMVNESANGESELFVEDYSKVKGLNRLSRGN